MRNVNAFAIINKAFLLSTIIFFLVECKKTSTDNGGGNGGGGNGGGVIQPPVDPPIANTIGFFLNDWSSRSFTIPAYTDTTIPSSASVFITIDASNIITKIAPSVFGQNANIWMTQMVTEPALINHITNLQSNIIRFPGGSLSDVFFWNANPGVHPPDAPDSLMDANGNKIEAGYWYGKNSDWWTMSLDNYYNMLQQTGNHGIITINYGYARYGTGPNPVTNAAHLAADWVRYDNGRTKYWEIGNESNGTWEAGYRINTATNHDAQPQIITGTLYGQHFKIFADSMKRAAQQIGKTIYIGAQLLEKQPETWQTQTDHGWNPGVLSQVKTVADFYIIHSYFTPYQQNSDADVILNTAVDNMSAMIGYLKSSLTFAGAEMKPVALTEWNITSQGSMQQVSFINGIHAAILLGEALKNDYGQTSRWDLANGWSNGNDHGLFNIGDEPGVSKWNPRPAFYFMYYFKKMLGDRLLKTTATGTGDILTYGSSFTSGEKAVIVVNKGHISQTVGITLQNATEGPRFYWYLLTGGSDNGEFSRKVFVNGRGPAELSGGPATEYSTLKPYSAKTQNGIRLTLPARSVAYVVIDK
jgi:hypothetical protein